MRLPQQHESCHLNVWIVTAIMKAIFGTDARMERAVEKDEANQILTEVEIKISALQSVLDHPAKNLDEAMQQVARNRK